MTNRSHAAALAGAKAGATIALIVAAGRGERLSGMAPKQYLELGGRMMLRWSAEAFLRVDQVDGVRVVINPADREHYDRAVAGLDLLDPVAGGATRQDSVMAGLESLADLAPARVLIHDAARPLVTPTLAATVAAALDRAPGAIPALALADSLKRAAGDKVEATVPRERLWRVQTPQAFRYPEILAAHRAAAGLALTDDAAVAEHAGLEVLLIEGSEDNFKVTTVADFARAERLIAAEQAETRIGTGFDVHRFAAGDHVTICGVKLAHDAGLAGHSDADVGIHAVVDALLGAIGAGDIGQHFPPSDARWRGADSAQFLEHARTLIDAAGGTVINIDVTVICERPRIGPHRSAMVARLAEILGLPGARVSVKATTTEQLGFTGRGEGIAAQAVAAVRVRR